MNNSLPTQSALYIHAIKTIAQQKEEIKRLRKDLADAQLALVETEECFDEANDYILEYLDEIKRLQAIVDKPPRRKEVGDGTTAV